MTSVLNSSPSSLRSNLLETCSLLTQLQSHLVPEGFANFDNDIFDHHDAGGHEQQSSLDEDNMTHSQSMIVTVDDLLETLRFRDLRDREADILGQIAVSTSLGNSETLFFSLSRFVAEDLHEELDRVREKIKNTKKRIQRIDRMWTRLEVWWNKALSQQLLIARSTDFMDDASRMVHCCFSPLLNLPGSAHFEKILPKVAEGARQTTIHGTSSAFAQHEVSCCSLSLPPNKNTSAEIARILSMVMLLEEDTTKTLKQNEKVHQSLAMTSPFCLYDGMLNRSKITQQIFGRDFRFTLQHLVALWTRAQRNTQAMRHLLLLFNVQQRVGNKWNGNRAKESLQTEHTRNPQGPYVHDKMSSLKITLSGNPPNARSRIIDVSNLVDEIVEYVVTNQVIFTHRQMQKKKLLSSIFQKKRRVDVVRNHEERLRKKYRRVAGEDTKNPRISSSIFLLILRWFSRRNRYVTSFLFGVEKRKQHLDLFWNQTDRRKTSQKLVAMDPERFRQAFLGLVKSAGPRGLHVRDWNLALLDQTLQRQDYADVYDALTFRNQILTMLVALRSAYGWNALQDSRIKDAQNDIKTLHNQFLSSFKPNEAVAAILPGLDSTFNVCMAVSGFERPWPDRCCICGSHDGALMPCACCAKIFHSKCMNHESYSMHQIASSHQWVQKMMKLHQPKSKTVVPDFTGDKEMRWSNIVINIDRSTPGDGQIQPLGLSMQVVKDCEAVFEKLSSPSASMLDLLEEYENEKDTKRKKYPLKGVARGYIVTQLKENFCGKMSGVEIGDIIKSVEHQDVLNAGQPAVMDLSRLSRTEMLEALKIPSKKLKIHISRVNREILSESRNWYKALLKLNPNFMLFSSVHQRYRFCSECLTDQASDIKNNTSSDWIVREARQCQAVIRRIGLEDAAVHFINEYEKTTSNSNTSNHDAFCLRRLDAIMTGIIARYLGDEEMVDMTNSAFRPPPELLKMEPTGELKWAPQSLMDKPTELLTSAILLWSSTEEISETRREAKAKILSFFLMLIPSWCMTPKMNDEIIPKTKGPPNIFLSLREPWLRESCAFCVCRPRAENDNIACGNAACQELSLRDSSHLGDLRKENSVDLFSNLLEYNEHASLVGTTILVPPDDPLVTNVSSIIEIDHCQRPVEFIVSSYIPGEFTTEVLSQKEEDIFLDKIKEKEGLFHLLPVVSASQLSYLLERCDFRQRNGLDINDPSWAIMDFLKIPGIARFSPTYLKSKIEESNSIRHAIESFISQLNVANSSGTLKTRSLNTSSTLSQLDDRFRHCQSLYERAIACSLLPRKLRQALSNENFEEEQQSDFQLFEVGIQYSNQILNAIDITLDVLKASGAGCHLVYSDLHCSLPGDYAAIEARLTPKSLTRPIVGGTTTEKIVLLERKKVHDSEAYSGVGFGYEIVRWDRNCDFCIGRVHNRSPAHDAGLRTGDFVISINGKPIEGFMDKLQLALELLGASLHVRITDQSDGLRQALSIVKQLNPPLKPVVITIRRPELSTDEQIESSTSNLNAQIYQPQSTIAQTLKNTTETSYSRQLTGNDLNHNISVSTAFTELAGPQGRDNEIFHEDAAPTLMPGHNARNAPSAQQIPTIDPLQELESIQTEQYIQDSVENPSVPVQTEGRTVAIDQRNKVISWFQLSQAVNHFNNISENLRLASIGRKILEFSDLYLAAGGHSVLSRVECSVFFECLLQKKPQLGIRFLSPRYSLRILKIETHKLATWSVEKTGTIPRLPASLFSYFLGEDYKRATSQSNPETGGYVFMEDNLTARYPIYAFPLDRMAETFFGRSAGSFFQNRDPPHNNRELQNFELLSFPRHDIREENTNSDHIRRMRGGGPEADSGSATAAMTSNTNHEHSDQSMEERRPQLDNVSDKALCIAELPVSQWNAKAVYSIIVVEEDESTTMIVGFVRQDHLKYGETPDTVSVATHYVQRIGYLKEEVLYDLSPDDVYTVDENATSVDAKEALCVIKKLQKEMDTNCTDIVENDDDRAFRFGSQPSPSEMISESGRGLTVLGNVPDGREIIWLTNDPSSVYIACNFDRNQILLILHDYVEGIRNRTIDLGSGSQFLQNVEGDTICCPWGCSQLSDSMDICGVLSFDSIESLESHLTDYHLYGTGGQAHAIELLHFKKFHRISAGSELLNFCFDLSAAIASQCPDAATYTGDTSPAIKLNSGGTFVKSPGGAKIFLPWSETSFRKKLVLQSKSKNYLIKSIVDLWAQLGNFFHIDGDGAFKLSNQEFEPHLRNPMIFPFTQISLSGDEIFNSCQTEKETSMNSPVPARFLNCTLCSLPWENSTDHAANVGLGCLLRSEAAFGQPTRTLDGISGKTGEAKALLLQIADLIKRQKGLLLHENRKDLDPCRGHRLWDGDNFDTWYFFVLDCTNDGMLRQALTVLVASINRTKMPKWWRLADSGWSTSQMIMTGSSIDALFFHLYVLDAALSETIGQSLLGWQSSKSKRKHSRAKETTQEQLSRWISFANELQPKFQVYHDAHASLCLYCDDGGELLCCEFCENVAHGECCEPKILEQQIKDSDMQWVCDSCINDICQAKGIARDEYE